MKLWLFQYDFSYVAIAFALIRSMMTLIPNHTVRSVKTSAILPLSVNGASWSTDMSFIRLL